MLDVLPLLTFGAVSLVVAACLVAWPHANTLAEASAETVPAHDRQHAERSSDGVAALATGMVVTAVVVIVFVMLADGRVTSSAVPIVPLLGLIGSVAAGLLYGGRKGSRSLSSPGDSFEKRVDDVVVTEQ
jgi:Na+/H+ antiporter NhaD/arsenite permease-like protein